MVQPSLVEMDSVSAVPLLKIKLTLHQLAKINAPNAVDANRSALTALGGVDAIAKKLAGTPLIYRSKFSSLYLDTDRQ